MYPPPVRRRGFSGPPPREGGDFRYPPRGKEGIFGTPPRRGKSVKFEKVSAPTPWARAGDRLVLAEYAGGGVYNPEVTKN